MRHGTRATLVAGAIVAAIATGPVAVADNARGGATTTFVLRGVAVQYIPPAGHMVGSLSLRVTRAGKGAARLTGELVTIAVEPGDAATRRKLKGITGGSGLRLELRARSAASVLKGGARLQTVVAAAPPSSAPPSPPPPPPATTPPAAPDPGASDGSGAAPGKSQGDDHGKPHGDDHGNSNGGGNANGGGNGDGGGNGGSDHKK